MQRRRIVALLLAATACLAAVAMLIAAATDTTMELLPRWNHWPDDLDSGYMANDAAGDLRDAQGDLKESKNLLNYYRVMDDAPHAVHQPSEREEESGSEPRWGYGPGTNIVGQSAWGTIPGASKCATGMRQSPIAIESMLSKYDDEAKPLKWTFELEQPGPGISQIEYDGHVLEINNLYAQVSVNNREFHLDNIVFHTRSEHTINGKDFPVEMQMTHKNDDEEVLIVSFLFSEDVPALPFMDILANHLPTKQVTTHSGPGQGNFETFLTQLLSNTAATRYWTFGGSLTTPPCTEGVQWVVMSELVGIDRDQAIKLAAIQGSNHRQTQPINGRPITRSFQ